MRATDTRLPDARSFTRGAAGFITKSEYCVLSSACANGNEVWRASGVWECQPLRHVQGQGANPDRFRQ